MIEFLGRCFSFKTLLCVILLSATAACSSVTKGTTQEVFVETPNVRDASCTLENSKQGIYKVAKTPGYAIVKRGGGDIRIKCEKENFV